MYIKTFSAAGEVTGVEELNPVCYIRYQVENNLIVRCDADAAQGVLSQDGASIYFKDGIRPTSDIVPYYIEITQTEYNALRSDDDEADAEDTDPQPSEDSGVQPMTRAELTAKVEELEQEIELLLSGEVV